MTLCKQFRLDEGRNPSLPVVINRKRFELYKGDFPNIRKILC